MTIQQLNEYVVEKLKASRDEAFTKHLVDFFREYQEKVSMLESMPSSTIIDDVKLWCDGILDSLRAYEQADMVKAILTIQNILKEHKNQLTECCLTPTTNDKWYRMRELNPNTRPFRAREMFHVPFSKRGKLGNNRFSISGYPCLYLSKSIWACWEEMHEPDIKKVCVSKVKVVRDIKLLDLSWPKVDESTVDKYKVICTWPLIIACSIRTLHPNDTFKPEYIIPQLIMLAIKNASDYWGCLYTSTQQNDYFPLEYEKLTNAAIPVSEIQPDKEMCPILSSKFSVSDSINEEYLRLCGNLNPIHMEGSGIAMTADMKYDYSNFGLMEKELEKPTINSLK